MSSQVIITGFDPEGPFANLLLPKRFRDYQRGTRFKQAWKLTAAQYMRMLKGPRRQRGIIMATPVYGAAAPSGFVVVNTHSFSATTNGPCTSGVRFDQNGEMYEIDSVTGNVQQNGEWWSDEPETDIGDDYEVRALSAGKTGTWSNAAAADDVWITMNVAQRLWDVDAPTDTNKLCTATFEVGPDGVESADDSAAITCNAIDLGL